MTRLKKSKERDLFSVKSHSFKANKNGPKRNQKNTKLRKKPKYNDQLEVEFSESKKSGSAKGFDYLSYEKITEGQIILGCISEVRQYEIVVSLPQKLIGSVPITNISVAYKKILSKIAKEQEITEDIHSLNELFPVGHFIITRVKSVANIADSQRVKVILSMMPEDVNFGISPKALNKGSFMQCSVQSIEDHGYVLESGVSNIRSTFLPKKGAPKYLETIGIGSVMICVVKHIEYDEEDPDNNIRIKVTAKNKHISQSSLPITSETNLDMLLPGTLLDATIEKVNEQNLEISAELLRGFVSTEHLLYPSHTLSDYSIGQRVQARILYVSSFTNVVHFTLNPNICSSRVVANPYGGSLHIGKVVDNAKILKNSMHGIYLQLPDNYRGFCSTYQLQDKPMTTLKKLKSEFPVGTAKPCRIMHYCFMDEMFLVSLKKSVISDQVVGRMELQVGQSVNVKIKSHLPKGAIVALGRSIDGFVPRHHLTDSYMKNPENKCPVGQTFKARILKNDSNDRGPVLTLKSILINSKLPIVQDFDETNVGIVTEGVITKIYDKTLLIELFGGAKGILPIQKTAANNSTDDLSDIYKEGDVLRCKVVTCKKEEKMIVLSTKYQNNPGTSENKATNELKPGSTINCVVKSVESNEVIVSVENSRKDITFIIPVYHLADDVKLCTTLINCLKTGDIIIGGIVFYIDKSTCIISLKPIIYNMAQNAKNKSLSHSNDLVEGDVVPSVVSEVSQETLMLSLMKGKLGIKRLLYKADFVKESVDDLTKAGISIGNTILVKCLKINRCENPRLTSCWDEIKPDIGLSSFQLLYNNIEWQKLIKSAFVSQKGAFASFSKIKVGTLFEAKVVFRNKDAVFVSILNLDFDGVISSSHQDPSLTFEVGSTVSVRVLHVNFKCQCLELTTKKTIKKMIQKKNHNLEVGQQCTCEILLSKQEYILCRLKTACVGHVVYLPSKRHINDFKGRRSFYEIGKKINVVIRYINNLTVLADFCHHCKGNEPINISEDLPKFTFKKEKTGQLFNTLAKNKENYTKFDFQQKVATKIREVTEIRPLKNKQFKKMALSFAEKLKILKADNFSQFDDYHYWTTVVEAREKRKKMKKHGLVPETISANNKRSMSLSSDNNESSTKRKKTENDDGSEEMELSATESEQNDNLEPTSCLPLKAKGFVWDTEIDDLNSEQPESSSDEEIIQDEKKKVKKLNKEEKLQRRLQKEQRLRELELQRRDQNRPLESAMDYEEMLQKNSSSSAAWVQYISYHLACAEIDKARAVAQKALKAIPATKEDDRLFVWGAILRLEVLFGTPETVESSFKEAVITNDELKILEAMAKIYADVNKMKEADDIFQKIIKKYSKSLTVWVNAGQFHYQNNRLKEARDIMDQSLLALSKKEHVEIVNKFAQFEFRYGEPETGKTMFESILNNFPKRIDIWTVYADLLTKRKDIEGARNILERMTNLNLRTKQMRSIFKKLLAFEQKHGTSQTVEVVKSRITDYVAAALEEEG